MVKVENDYGDVLTGKCSNAIYQRFYGQQIRRKGYKETKTPSKAQQLQRNKFKDAISWIKTLTQTQRTALKTYYRNSKLSYDPNYPINWYNFAKLLYIKKPTFEILDNLTKKYSVHHPGIKKVEEKSSSGLLLYSSDNLSSIEDQLFVENYEHTPVTNTSEIVITTLSGLEYNYIIGEIIGTLIYCDINYCDPNYCM